MSDKLYQVKPLLDTSGRRVQAHGGSVFYEDGVYYFYGENKEKTTGKDKIWTWGVRAYSSCDLVNWKDEGLIIPPELEDKKSLLHPYHHLDRPHIVRSKKTGKYVCWLKFCGKNEFCFAVLVADQFLGPYKLIKSYFRPYDADVGDFDIHDFGERGVYLYFADGKKGIIGCRLTDDCTDVTEEHRLYYSDRTVPYCREAVAVFEAKENIYMLTSGMTSYVPNPSEAAKLSAPLGELTELGDPHIGDKSGASFLSQISCVFLHRGTNTHIAVADRWIASFQSKREQHLRTINAIAACCAPGKYHAQLKDIMAVSKLPLNSNKIDTSVADYVILPIEWEGEKPVIRWKDEWRMEDFQ